jgi:hypothetical protein
MEYYMDCNNEECGWSGVVDWDEIEKCPVCGHEIEPSNEGPTSIPSARLDAGT